MLIIRQEEDAAQLSADLTDDAQAQSRTLQDELDERVQFAKASAEAHLQEQLKADMVAEERKRMIDKHEMDVKAMETQLALDTARQQSGMEQQLAARRAKKLRIMEQVPPLVAATDMIATAHTRHSVCIHNTHTHTCIQMYTDTEVEVCVCVCVCVYVKGVMALCTASAVPATDTRMRGRTTPRSASWPSRRST